MFIEATDGTVNIIGGNVHGAQAAIVADDLTVQSMADTFSGEGSDWSVNAGVTFAGVPTNFGFGGGTSSDETKWVNKPSSLTADDYRRER